MDAEAERSAIAVGSTVGPYKLLRLLGAGASGQVFEVEHVTIGRRAALKLLNPDHALLPSALRRLFAEAQAVNRINHPHIVEITDVIEPSQPGAPGGVVMELLEGESLAEVVSRRKRLPAEQLPALMAQVADALAGAHAAGFVHRDLKPENVFLARRADDPVAAIPFVKLLDFGLAKSLVLEEGTAGSAHDTLSGRSHRTVEGTFLGTPAYASPEQAAGKPVDHRTDLYAFGVILYELLCGRLPFEGQNLGEYLVKHITVMPPPVPPEIVSTALGGALGEMAMRCLRKDPAARYGSAAEIRDQLQAWADALGPVAAGPVIGGRPWGRRRLLAVAGAALGVAAVGVAAMLLTGRRAPRRPEATVEAGPGRLVTPPRTPAPGSTRPAGAHPPGATPAPRSPSPSAGWVPIPPRRRTSPQSPSRAAPGKGSRGSGQRERTLDPWRR